MQKYILYRLLQMVMCLLVISFVVFVSARLAGDPITLLLPENATPEDEMMLRAHLGLDKPILVQYGLFLSHALSGDLGNSVTLYAPVIEILKERLPATLELGVVGIAFSLIIALPVGVYAAVRRGSWFDFAGRMFAVLGQAMPAFWLGLMLMLVFGVKLGILPISGRGGLQNLILPGITIGWFVAAGIMRLTRSSMLDVLDSEYIKLARIKGLSEQIVIWKHAFKNALLPVATYSVVLFAMLLAGSVVTETVFAWPGIGRLLIEAVVLRDFPVVQGVVLVLATFFIIGNFIVDILYAYLNPRIKV
jgi:peptide/nickel transport system permease protein